MTINGNKVLRITFFQNNLFIINKIVNNMTKVLKFDGKCLIEGSKTL